MRHITRFPGWRHAQRLIVCAGAMALLPIACGGTSDDEPSVVLSATSPNVVSYWNDVANRTLHVAIYDAVSAIDGRFVPFATAPTTSPGGASIDAAASAAAYGVLRALYPGLIITSTKAMIILMTTRQMRRPSSRAL